MLEHRAGTPLRETRSLAIHGSGGDPSVPCHFDVTTSFGAQAVADAISDARDAVLGTVDVVEGSVPRALVLAPPLPNPALRSALLRFDLPRAGSVTLAIHDVGGRWVRTLASGRFEAGSHSIAWDLRDHSGTPVPSGLYFVRLRAAGASRVRRLSVVP